MTARAERTLMIGAVTQPRRPVPVTARLSRRFYDAIGDDAANDLVNWMNDVDATYRTDLLRLNDANLDRFSAEIARHAAELRGEMDRRFAELRGEIDRRFAELDTRLSQFEARMLRWMLVFWTGTMAGAAATIIAVTQSR